MPFLTFQVFLKISSWQICKLLNTAIAAYVKHVWWYI